MRKTTTTETLICDFCEKEIKDKTSSGSGTVMGKDACPACLTLLHKEVDLEYRRVIHSEVPSRRGGFRQLGEYDS